ncbi:MAG: glycosyltransferase family 2 protein [Microgenomates group bacterium]
MKVPLCSIIILNYHTDEMTFRLVDKLRDDEFEIILVDNSSSENLKARVASLHHVLYTNPGANLGFAGGVNFGIKQSKGEWIMLLNSDADTDIKTIKELINKCKSVSMKVATPRLINGDGTIETNVGLFSTIFEHPINWLFLRPRFVLPETDTKVHTATGGALLIHRSIIEKVGLLDDKNFFMYFEDMDYSYRLHNAGISVLYVPTCVVNHIGGGSSDKNPTQKKQSYFTSLDKYLLKHRGSFILWLNKIFKFLA